MRPPLDPTIRLKVLHAATSDPSLPPSCRRTLAAMLDLANADGEVALSFTQIGRLSGVRRNNAMKNVNRLEACGYVSRRPNGYDPDARRLRENTWTINLSAGE